MKEYPFFFTWDKQSSPHSFNLKENKEHQLILDENKIVDDLSSLSFQASFGLKNKIISNSIKKMADKISVTTPKAVFDEKILLSHKLLNLIGKKGKIFYTTGGSLSIENALKIVRQVTKRKYVVARKDSYHGSTLGALSVTGDWRGENHLTLSEYTLRIPSPTEDPDFLKAKKIIKDFGVHKVAAFCLESITGGNGVILPSKSWWTEVSNFAKENNIKIILDEVVCGFYRTGRAFGFEHFDIEVDFICMAKALTGGMVPFGALWVSDEIAEYYNEHILSCGLTDYAHPLGIAASLGVFEIIESDKFQQNLRKLITEFSKQLAFLKQSANVENIRSVGALAAIEIKKDITFETALDNGLYLYVKNKMIILAPHLTLTPEKLKISFKKLIKLLEFKNE